VHSRQFSANATALENVRLHQVALGPERERAVLHVTDFSDASSVLPLAETSCRHFGIREVEKLPVELFRLDDYLILHQLPSPDLIKLDVQGYELEVLGGAVECLATTKAIIIEVSFVEFYQKQCLFEDVVQFLKHSGFRLRALGVNTPLGQPLFQTDALFTHQSASSAAI
jgi:FkbM family methyltransferase